jgi:7,8-dihydropterin-6-yl-methyl-4-(beta-D-ribofuranosyl)aminobenzene 5'-phosphate synthase
MDVPVPLRPIDSLEATILVDNQIDILLPSTDRVRRAPLALDWSTRAQLIAEHGYAVLLTIRERGTTRTLLYDAGLGRDTLGHNLDVLGISTRDLEAIALSHGHADHHGGFEGLARTVGRRNLPLVLHPDAWRTRKVVFPSGIELNMPPPDRKALERADVRIVEDRGPSLLLGEGVLLTGQVERTTEFEKGFPWQQARTDGGWEPDPWIWDDQGVVVHVRGKGLVVVSSCSHAGVINVLRNGQRLTGIRKVHAFLGGLHLTGGLFEPIIPQTVEELVRIAPDVIVPGHCTGWKATHETARRLPLAYVQTSVGTTVRFD